MTDQHRDGKVFTALRLPPALRARVDQAVAAERDAAPADAYPRPSMNAALVRWIEEGLARDGAGREQVF